MSDLDHHCPRARSGPGYTEATAHRARLVVADAALTRWPGHDVRGFAVDDAAEPLDMLGLGEGVA